MAHSKKKKPKQKQQEEQKSRLASFMGWLGRMLVLGVIWGGVAVIGLVAYYSMSLPDVEKIAQAQRRPSVSILSEDGTEIARYGDLAGETVGLANVPDYLVKAILAIEDRRFYDHFGVDVFGIARAMAKNVMAGRFVQGGSTITQQLAKNLFLSPERTIKRKIQEMLLALWLEQKYSKDQILTAYLNRVYLGAGAYGVDAASRVYFGKPVWEINLQESATLAGLLRAPSRFSPTNNAKLSAARAKTVLAAMVEAGYITAKQRKHADETVGKVYKKQERVSTGSYFADFVIEKVGGILADSAQDIVIQTTLEADLQRMAQREVDAMVDQAAKRDIGQIALVSLAHDGGIKAMIGGRSYRESQYNRITQAKRQPGSAFKPIIYLAGLQKGLEPSTIFNDEPLNIDGWKPTNYKKEYQGYVTMREALISSINTVAVLVLKEAGVRQAIKAARSLGIDSALEPDLSLALGSSAVNPMELVSAYATLATGGQIVTPYAIKEVRTTSGEILYKRMPFVAPQTVERREVEILVDIMEDVVKSGTGRRAMLDRPVAGKTGTSSDYKDAWFIGFTADYTTGVWMGNDDNKPMKGVTGGSLPAILWKNYMQQAELGLPSRSLLKGQGEENSPLDFLGDLIKRLTN